MKTILAFLLTVIVAAGIFAPCCIYDNCQDDITPKQDAPKKNTTEGSCSPFSTCASCHGFTTIDEPITVEALAPEHPEHHAVNMSFVATAFTSSRWQPPRYL